MSEKYSHSNLFVDQILRLIEMQEIARNQQCLIVVNEITLAVAK
jgi:hypothetical protein